MKMEPVEKSIEIDAPVRTVYNQWTQFETFPQFMEGVKSVKQLDDKTLAWTAEIAGKDVSWTAEIVQQVPDQIIRWQSIAGARNHGEVRFEPLGPNRTKVYLNMGYEPETFGEKVADALGIVGARIKGDLERFKKFIEKRDVETGAWRGEVRGGEVREGQFGERHMRGESTESS